MLVVVEPIMIDRCYKLKLRMQFSTDSSYIFTATCLVVDEDPLAREAIAYALEELRYTVIALSDLNMAIGAIGAVSYDILVVDMQSQTLDELEVVLEARRLQPLVRIIAVSHSPIPDQLVPHVDLFLLKPFTNQQIRNAATRILSPLLGKRHSFPPR